MVALLRRLHGGVTATIVLAVLGLGGPLGAANDAIFDVEGNRPRRAVLTRRADLDERLLVDAPMAHAVAGVLLDLDRGRVGRLLRCTRATVELDERAPTERVCYVHLFGRSTRAVAEIVRTADGRVAAVRRDDTAASTATRLDEGDLSRLLEARPPYRGVLERDAVDFPIGRLTELDPPYVPGTVTMDRPTMMRRIYRGLPVVNPGTDRALEHEVFHVRLPDGYDPRSPAGLIVWVSPTPDGRVPRQVARACDELTLIAVGIDNAGNDRDVQDKFQLVFDAVATVTERFHVDARRVYLLGMSGGGKVASILTLCFPEVFGGAVAIVGLASQHLLDAEFEEHRQPYFAEPRGAVEREARQRPIAVISGPRDYNYREMQQRAERLEADGYRVRMFSVPELGHEMPDGETLLAALRYVDQPYRNVKAREAGAAQLLLAAYFEQRDALGSAKAREALTAVLRAGPWTSASWRAIELLREPN